MRTVLAWIGAGLVIAVAAAALWVRLAPSDPARWHVDPLHAPMPGTPNAFRAAPETAATPSGMPAPVYALPTDALAASLDAVAMAQPRVTRLARSEDGHWTTYVARSRLMGFPDYVSVRVIPLGADRSTLAIFSRARFGSGDFGVNADRVKNWLAALAKFER